METGSSLSKTSQLVENPSLTPGSSRLPAASGPAQCSAQLTLPACLPSAQFSEIQLLWEATPMSPIPPQALPGSPCHCSPLEMVWARVGGLFRGPWALPRALQKQEADGWRLSSTLRSSIPFRPWILDPLTSHWMVTPARATPGSPAAAWLALLCSGWGLCGVMPNQALDRFAGADTWPWSARSGSNS